MSFLGDLAHMYASNVSAPIRTITNAIGWDPTPGGRLTMDGYKTNAQLGRVSSAQQTPQIQQQNPIGNNTNTGGTGGGGRGGNGGNYWANSPTSYSSSYSSAPAYDPNVAAQYQQGVDQLNNSMGRLGNQLSVAQGNINNQYNQNLNELNSALNAAKGQYNTQTTQNHQQLRTNKNTILDQGSNGLRGLSRMLGSMGAGGSSDMLNASQAVQSQMTQQNNGAGQTYAQNQSSLDTNWGNYQNQDKNKRAQLNDWRTQQLNSAQAQSDTARQSLLTQLAQAQSQLAAYKGGNGAAAAQPLLNQANALSAQIDNLGRINPTYSGSTPVYQAQALSSYDTGRGTGATVDPTQGAQSPEALAVLLGLNNDKKQQNLAA